jgi:hypothetical protein
LHAWIRQRQYKEKWENPLAFGEAWSRTHALNLVVLDDKDAWLAELQPGDLVVPDDHDIVFVRL